MDDVNHESKTYGGYRKPQESALKSWSKGSDVVEAIESLDPAQYPCALLAQLWYAWLAIQDA
jgi:hypothetical protein